MTATLHHRYFDLVETLERTTRVAEWRSGDIDLWPLARQDLFLELFRRDRGDTAAPPAPFAIRAALSLAAPVTNLWKSRHDLAHWLARPHSADAVLLGDGTSLDRVDGAWRDRYGEPILAALERRGDVVLALQPGDLARLPWLRPTLAINARAGRAALAGTLARTPSLDLPDHAAVLRRVAEAGVTAASLERARLGRRARMVAAQAAAFDRVLRIARPRVAFTVTWYAGLGSAFALACRRRGILCVDLQHCPQEDAHRGYRWWSLPGAGYATLPALFWTWNARDAAQIDRWAATLDRPWHAAIHGGHTQIAACEADAARWQSVFDGIGEPACYDREILVALQPIGDRADHWSALAGTIAASPPRWRWWLRRHPASTAAQDAAYGGLLQMERANVVVGPASDLPLPALLRQMDALVSLASGSVGEAAAFGVPAFFLDPEALGPFGALIARGEATMADPRTLPGAIARLAHRRARHATATPPIAQTLAEIDRLAERYARLCGARVTARANRAN